MANAAMTDTAVPPTMNAKPLLRVEDLSTYFPVRSGLLRRTVGHVRAVHRVSFEVYPGETLGIVGESGCGKSTMARSILRLLNPTSGHITFDDQNVLTANRAAMRGLRRRMQIIFQDPVGSLNPRMTIGRIIGEPIAVHRIARGQALAKCVAELLQRVGLSPEHAQRYPHEFSGGQRQRIGIARALAVSPQFIVCDEPVSALDVSIQSQILNLLDDLQKDLGLAYLFIAHNLAVVEHFCDRIAVMYLGRLVEVAQRRELYEQPRHPYTQALLRAAPHPRPRQRRARAALVGEVPSPVNPPSGCAFHPRCDLARNLAESADPGETVPITVQGHPTRVMKRCHTESPTLATVDGNGHICACHYQDVSPTPSPGGREQ